MIIEDQHKFKYLYNELKLSNQYGNSYFGNIYIGSNNDKFKVIFDTGSSFNWIAQGNCTSCKQSGIKNLFNCQSSSTCNILDKSKKIQYGKGETRGQILEDQFKLSSFVIQKQIFLSIYYMHDLKNYPADGLIGLGFKTLSDNYPTILDNMKEQGLIKNRVFSMCLTTFEESNNNFKSFLTLGGVDNRFVRGSVQARCKIISNYYWAIDIKKITLKLGSKLFSIKQDNYNDGTDSDFNLNAKYGVIDSGTSIIALPKQDYDSFLLGLSSLGLDCYSSKKYNQIACKQLNIQKYPHLIFTMCGFEFTIGAMQYVLCGLNSECIVRITHVNISGLILGDIFMQPFYTIFNQDSQEITFTMAQKQHRLEKIHNHHYKYFTQGVFIIHFYLINVFIIILNILM